MTAVGVLRLSVASGTSIHESSVVNPVAQMTTSYSAVGAVGEGEVTSDHGVDAGSAV